MGPQPFGCGRLGSLSEEPVRKELQWGRNLSVAEGSQGRSCARRPRSFNGAATFRLRKDVYMRIDGKTLPGFNGAATFRLRKDRIPPRL